MAAAQDRPANESRKGDEQITNSKQQSRQRYDKWQQPRPRARLWVVLVQHHHHLLTRNGHWAGLSAPPSVTEKVALHVCVIAPRCDSSSTFRTERTGEEPWPRQATRSRAAWGRNPKAVGARPEGAMKRRAIGPRLMSWRWALSHAESSTLVANGQRPHVAAPHLLSQLARRLAAFPSLYPRSPALQDNTRRRYLPVDLPCRIAVALPLTSHVHRRTLATRLT
jgi:hypothetical protein